VEISVRKFHKQGLLVCVSVYNMYGSSVYTRTYGSPL